MELNFGTDIENTDIIIYVLAINHFVCYSMSGELSLFSTQCQLHLVIILRSNLGRYCGVLLIVSGLLFVLGLI